MSHGLRHDTVNGESFVRAAFNGEKAWHELGQRGEFKTFPELRDAARMNYRTGLVQAFAPDRGGTRHPVPGQFFVQRSDDGCIVAPNTVSENYEVLQVDELFEIMKILADQGFVEPATALVINDGCTEIVTARFVEQGPTTGGSAWTNYMNLWNNHGGTGKAGGNGSSIRIVCKNTFNASIRASGQDFALRHSQGMTERFKVAAMAMQCVQKQRDAFFEIYGKLQMFAVDVPKAVEAVLGLDSKPREDWTTQAKNKRQALLTASNLPAAGTEGKTAADVLNAVTYWTTHNDGGKDGTDASSRVGSMILGTRAAFEARAFSVLSAMAGV